MKVTTKTLEYVNWNEDLEPALEALLSEKKGHKVNLRDYAGRYAYYHNCKAQADALHSDDAWYKTSPLEHTPQQKEQYDLYLKLTASVPEYQDFWHWVVDHHQVSNGSIDTFYWNDMMEDMNDEDSDHPAFVKEIWTALGELLTDDQKDEMDVMFDW